ncbi:MAG: preprotein translocase subunit SecA [Planctomycetes bacterium]|nr:preprotein translocase subunit SecA [Planctomycetota bacterium]
MAELEFIGRALKSIFGSRNERVLRDLAPVVGKVNALEPKFESLTDAKLRDKTAEFRGRLKKGETLDDLLPEAFAACRESAKRAMGMRHFDVQLLGGLVLHQGRIAEMATGEGKTLVATLPAYLNALAGRGVHVVTVNDYLARRDAKWMGPVFKTLGIDVGVIQAQMAPHVRVPQYRCDITYGTNSEFGFDYLRDNMKLRLEEQGQQGKHFFAIIDEVDSILIDEARTPLIIAGTAEESTERYYIADRAVKQLEETRHFEVNEKDHHVVLTEEGIERIHELLATELKGGSMYDPGNLEWVHHTDVALKGNNLYKLDKHYVVQDEGEGPEVVIVDEFTGRKMKGRRWSDGLHQAVEAKEGLQIREENQTLATITYQNFFRLYDKLGGMTGTALTEAEEFNQIYKLDVVSIPSNRRMRRSQSEDFIYRTEPEKIRAVVTEIAKTYEAGRPVLVGTTSVEKSESLSGLLSGRTLRQCLKSAPAPRAPQKADPSDEKAVAAERAAQDADRLKWDTPLVPSPIPHELLNAKQHEREAHIIVKAGQTGAVTIATNMAGRGTDILLGPGVAEKGGLHVVGTERHEARRIDNQLRGRAGRQGDPGSSQFFLSLEDDLMRIFAKQWVSDFLGKLGMQDGEEIQHSMVTRMIERVQRKMESHNFDIRKNLLEYDAVNNDQRKVVYGWRQTILEGADQEERIRWAIEGVCEGLANHHLVVEEGAHPDLEALLRAFSQRFGDEGPAAAALKEKTPESGTKVLLERGVALYAAKRESVGVDRMKDLERYILLQTIDEKWKDNLQALDYLRTGIGMRGYGQEDPKIVYRREAADYFAHMISAIREQVVELLFRVQPQKAADDVPASNDDEPSAPSGPAPFDEDEWGDDDDGIEWDKIVARDSLQRIASAMEQQARAAAGVPAETAPDAAAVGTTATMSGTTATMPTPTATLSGMGDEDDAPSASMGS